MASFEAGVPFGSYPVVTRDGKWPGTIVTCLSLLKNNDAATGAERSASAARRERGLGVLRYAAKFESVGGGDHDRVRAIGDSSEEYHNRAGDG